YRLQKKHRLSTVSELLALQATLEEKNSLTANLDDALAQAQRHFEDAQTKLKQGAQKLSDSRRKVFAPLSKQLVSLLQQLGIPEAQVQIEASVTEPSASGIDKTEILFSANKGMAPRPLAQVASGGEFSRVMFSIKYIMTEKTAMPTLILDEIDTGISGEVAIRLGAMMKAMSAKHQIITITHLPQIAAKGDLHYFVFKDNSAKKTVSSIRKLSSRSE